MKTNDSKKSNEFVSGKGCYSGYEVSLDGKVRQRRTGKLLKIKQFRNGPNYVFIKINKKTKKMKVAELIANVYKKKKRKDMLRCVNGDWNDYSLDNLEWYNPRDLPENRTKSWKVIVDTNSRYEASEDGEIRSYKYCTILKPYDHNGRPYVTLSLGDKKKSESVAMLVAKTYIKNPDDKKIVGHRDGNVWNNHVDNLIWGKRDLVSTSSNLRIIGKAIDEYSVEGKFLRTWDTISSAARQYRISPKSIRSVCSGKYMTAGNRVWRYKGEAFNVHKVPDQFMHPGEYFMPIPNSNAEVSNYGRVRSTLNGKKILKPNEDGSVKIRINGKLTTKRVYILEAMVMLHDYHPEKTKIGVGFKDGDSTNLRVNNLEWIYKSEKENSNEGSE